MDKISDSDFREYSKNNAIKSAEVTRTNDGYVLVVQLTWKNGEYTLYTVRNRPRAWVSLDRMMAYLENNELKIQTIALQMNWKKEKNVMK